MTGDNATFQKIRSMPCLVCNVKGVDVAHVKSRGAGGSDEEFNLFPACRRCHQEQHKIGILSFIQKYLTVATYLYDHGWFILNGKLINERHVPREQIPSHLRDE